MKGACSTKRGGAGSDRAHRLRSNPQRVTAACGVAVVPAIRVRLNVMRPARLMKTNLLSLVLVALTAVASCGDPTDRPEDCTPNEFFDEARSLCLSCPAVVEPSCDDGCGFEITANEFGCPAAACLVGDSCDRCDALDFFSTETLTCEPCSGPSTCDEGEPTRRVDGDQCSLQCS